MLGYASLFGLGASCSELESDPSSCDLPTSGWGANCEDFQSAAATYTRLASKDKKASTKANAARYAQYFTQKYNRCVAAKSAPAAVSTPIPTTPAAPVMSQGDLAALQAQYAAALAALSQTQSTQTPQSGWAGASGDAGAQGSAGAQGQASTPAVAPQPWYTNKTIILAGAGALVLGYLVYRRFSKG